MSVKLQIKRGLADDITTQGGVASGELKYATDTEMVYIGNGTTNIPVGGADTVFKNSTQTLTNKTIDATHNTVSNLTASNFQRGMVTTSVASDYYYCFYLSGATYPYVYTKSISQGTVEIYTITKDANDNVTAITNIDTGTMSASEVLTYGSLTYSHYDTNNGYYIVGSASKLLNLDVAIQFYKRAASTGGSGSGTGDAITVVTTLPKTHDQTKLYKVSGTEAIWWWNGTEYIDISSESEMLEVTEFPTTDIKTGRLYKLTQNVTHLDTARYMMNEKEFTESATTAEEAYTHNTTTDKWYYDTEEITVLTPTALPEPDKELNGNYYYVGGSLYLCALNRPTIIDYYAGIYAYMNSGWRALYTENLMVDYNTGIAPSSLPKIGGVYVKGEHNISYYGGLTESTADGKYQPKTMDSPLSGFTATTVEGTLEELNGKISTATRIKGSVATYNDLPANATTGDMWVVKTYTDPSTSEEKENILFCWNGVDWFEYGSSDIDMTAYQRWEQKIDSFKSANPSMTFSDASSVAMNDEFTLARIEATLGTPVTDIQSPDRTLMNIPSDVDVDDGQIHIEVLTHSGSFTAIENVSELPSGVVAGYRYDYVNSIEESKLKKFNRMKKITAVNRDVELLGVWYEYYNGNYYYNGTQITPTSAETLPTASSSNEGTYYKLTSDSSNYIIYLSEYVLAVAQDVNQFTGELLYDSTGLPLVKQSMKATQVQLYPDSSETIYVLDTNDITPGHNDWVVGYEQVSVDCYMTGSPKTVDCPWYKVKAVTITSSSAYIEASRRYDSGLNINEAGVYGYYTLTESTDSKLYSNHGEGMSELPHGFNGTFTFTPASNVSAQQEIRGYVDNGKIKGAGNITIDKIYITGILH